jgi:WD40 repeat protein
MRFTPVGTLAVTIAEDDIMILWDIQTGSALRHWKVSDYADIRFSADGQYIIITGNDGTVYRWELLLEPDSLLNWTFNNRYVRDLTCGERELYRVEPLCNVDTK